MQPQPFHMLASTGGIFSNEEMDDLVRRCEPQINAGQLGRGSADAEVRRSQVAFLLKGPENDWIYERIWEMAVQFNQRFMGVDILGIEGNLQVARYDSSDAGFYTWHTDFGNVAQNRKISISVQLSASEDYAGGDLEFLYEKAPYQADRTRGTLIAFPSFVAHRVTPVTRGTRWSLVAWIHGNRWR